MSQFLETLRAKLADAIKRFQTAQQNLIAAQAENQALAQEVGSLQYLIQAEMRNDPSAGSDSTTVAVESNLGTSQPSTTQMPETNKTAMIRELLRRHPTGITPVDIWKELGTQMKHRAYIYSVLKRLKDRGEVMERRGKYCLRILPKPEEAKQQTTVQ